jgi:succinate dehydrogenase / fumarate reductase, cytochrome b subunit
MATQVEGAPGIQLEEVPETLEDPTGEGTRRFAYYPGCVAEFSSKELNRTTQALAPMLGIELLPMPAATCCGAGDIAEAKPNLYLTLNVRILSQAEEMGVDVLTICNVCTLNLRRANKMVKEDPVLLERVNQELVNAGARPYEGTKEVTHLLWFLATEEGLSVLEERGPRGLNGLRVAPYYGCQLLRPSSVMGFEDPDKPQSLERLITALGGEVADYEGKSNCCGFPIILARQEVALKESHVALSGARDAGADVMVTPCPLCHLAMDAYQRKAEAQNGTRYDMPVLHLPQLIGLALGMDTKTMEFKRHMVPVEDALSSAGLI